MFRKSLKNGCTNLLPLFPRLCFWSEMKIIFLSDITFPSWPCKSVNSNFVQYQSDRDNNKFNCCLEIQSKMPARISVCTLKPFKFTFKSNSYLMPISRRGPVNSSTPTFPISILQRQLKIYMLFQKSKKNACNNLYFYPYAFD